jgi:hypothetical protein
MKKSILTLMSSLVLSYAAVAANDQKQDQQDPSKDKEKKVSFSLTDGYFSIFEIFLEKPKVDTLRAPISPKPNNSGANKKK